MSFGPVREACIDFSDPAAPRSPEFDDVYHSRAGALVQAEHVFLNGSGLPQRWAGRSDFVILETGFGLGSNFLATWAAWRRDPMRCERLWFIAVEKHPPSAGDLARAHARSHTNPSVNDLARQLREAWPPATPDFHRVDLDQGRVRLILAWADIADVLPELVASVDAFFLDGFAPARNAAMWDARTLRNLRRLAATGATVATWSVAAPVREALSVAGFEWRKAPGVGGKREIALGVFASRHVAEPPPGRRRSSARQAIVVGAGLAGASAAQALARQGIETLVLDRHPEPAAETSGNRGGLYHGVVHGADGTHARWLRAAALRAHQTYRPLVGQGQLQGAVRGLLRGARDLTLVGMQHLLDAQCLPPGWAQALSADEATRLSGVPWAGPAWWMGHAGWVSPRQLVAHWLHTEGINWRGEVAVQGLHWQGSHWQLLDAGARVLAESEIVVLANAGDLPRLLGQAPGHWQRQRGQVSECDAPGHQLPLPLADGGYVIEVAADRLLFGATSQIDDDDAQVRDADHALNRASLQRLTGWQLPATLVEGRVGWRMQTEDRLPWVGPAPTPELPPGPRRDQPRFAPRLPGLYLLAGLGSRGLTHAPLAGELLASWITGNPMPMPSCLIDAVDPARHAARQARRVLNRT